MFTSNEFSSNANYEVEPNIANIFTASLQTTYSNLIAASKSNSFLPAIAPIFNLSGDLSRLQALSNSWASGDFSQLPIIEILPSNSMNGANGAFSEATRTIYLSSDYLAQNLSNQDILTGAVTGILLEEIGHFVDSLVNPGADTVGDEGALFSKTLMGLPLNDAEKLLIHQEDDHGFITIDGKAIAVEQSSTDFPVITIAATDASAAETATGVTANPGTFTLTRTGNLTPALTVNYTLAGTATKGVDYSNLTGTVSFAAGASTTTVKVTPTDDTLAENSETAILSLKTGTGYILGSTTTASVTIADNETPVITIAATDASAAETATGVTANPGTFTLTRTGNLTPALTVNYTLAGTATKGVDYSNLTGTVSFAAGASTTTVKVTPTDDTLAENSETAILSLKTGTGYILGSTTTASVTIADNETPVITIAATDASAAETATGVTANPGTFTLTRTGNLTPALTVNYTLAGTATKGVDYSNLTGTVSFAAGASTTTVKVTPTDDTLAENSETAILSLKTGTGYTLGSTTTASVTIADNETPVITIAATDASAAETATGLTANPGTFTLTRTGNLTPALTVNYTLAGTATNGVDYSNLTGTVSFAAGASTTTVKVTPTNDTLAENSETAILSLKTGTGYTLGSTTTASVTIADNETPVITIAATDASAAETISGQTANPGRFTLTRTGNLTQALTVNYTLVGTATKETDYTNLTGTVSFAAGSATALVNVTPIDDPLVEGNETAILTLATGTGYTVGTANTGTVAIADNDVVLPTITVAATDASAGETATGVTANTGRFTLTRTGNLTQALTVNYTLGGTATKGTDYTNLTGTVSFAAGAATALVNLTPINDTLAESNETVILTLAAGTGYSLGTTNRSTISIADNDNPTFYLNPDSNDPDYEELIKKIKWVELSVGNKVTVNGHTYTVDRIFDDTPTTNTGFYAVGFTSSDNTLPPVLVVRGTQGTEDPRDILQDANSQGIGFGQFSANKNSIKEWLNKFAVNSNYYPSITGESLGGSLAQSFAADYTKQGGKLSQVFTLNSAGIDDALASSFKPENVGKVTHGVVFGDIVSLGGEEFISGEFWLFDWNTEDSKIYGSPPLTNYILDKHNQEVDNLFNNPSISIVKGLGASDLSNSLFSYWNRSEISNEARKDWALFNGTIEVLGVVTGVVGVIVPPLIPIGAALISLPAIFSSRSSAELARLAGGSAITAIDDLINTLANPGIDKLVKLVTKAFVLTGRISSETLEAANDLSNEIVGGLVDVFIDVAKVLKNELSVGLGDIAHFLADELGAGLVDIAKGLYNGVTQDLRSIARGLYDGVTTDLGSIAKSLYDGVIQDIGKITKAILDEFGLGFGQLADVLWNNSLVANGRELANVLWNNTSATVSNIAHALKSQLNFATSSIADALSYGANLSINQITNALWDSAFVANGRELANVLFNNTSATVSNIAHALKSQLNFATSSIADALSYGANLSINQITNALWDSAFVANGRELANVLFNNTSATVSNIAHALKSQLNFATSSIADALSYGANLSINQITNALWDSAFVANGRELANVLFNNTSATVSNIAHALKSQLNFATSSIADALSYGANLSINQITNALWDSAFVANGRELANVLFNNTSATVSNIAYALKSQLNFATSSIADVLSYGANLSINQITNALWDSAFVANGRELANVLFNNTSATVSNIAHALKSQLNFATSSIADVLSYGANLSINQITNALWDSAFVANSRELANVLWNNTSATVSNVAYALKSQLNFTINTIADALDFGANLSINQITNALWDSAFVANADELSRTLWRSTRATAAQISSAFQAININISVGQVNNIVNGVIREVGTFFKGLFG